MTKAKSPRLILMCGLPGAGKTTLAKRLAEETAALRLSPNGCHFGRGIGRDFVRPVSATVR